MSVANTFTSLKPDMKEAYSDKKSKRFQRIRSRLDKDDKKCGCAPKKPKCECKEK